MNNVVSGIELGRTYEDVVTGFCGVATGVVQYLTGCHQVLLVGRVVAGAKEAPTYWLDVDRAQLQGEVPTVMLAARTHPGFDVEPPVR